MELAKLLLHVGVALTMTVYGLHQIIRPAGWLEYLPQWTNRIPIDHTLFMRVHGCGNLLLGLWLGSGLFPLWAGWVSLLWWVSILPFAFYYDWRDGMRDITIIAIIAAYIALL